MRRFPALIPLVLLSGCAPIPDSYPPPFQRPGAVEVEPDPVGPIAVMANPDAEAYFVQDIARHLEGTWRWANKRPTVRLRLQELKPAKLFWEFSIAGVTFDKTGPVTVSFFVNGKQVDRVRYAEPGDKRFEKDIPASLLRTDDYNIVAAEADRYWVAEADGVILSFTLTRIGLSQ